MSIPDRANHDGLRVLDYGGEQYVLMRYFGPDKMAGYSGVVRSLAEYWMASRQLLALTADEVPTWPNKHNWIPFNAERLG